MKVSSPLKSIRKYCLWCMCGSANEVKLCSLIDCKLWVYRLGKGKGSKMKTIKAKCLDCSENRTSVKFCNFNGLNNDFCYLHPYRNGKNPNRAIKNGSESKIAL